MAFDPDEHSWDLDLRAYRRTIAGARRLQPWFRPRYEGFETLRGERGIMLVANHGLFGQELSPLLVGAWDHAHRPIRAIADHVLFATAIQRRVMESRGAAEGTPAVAHKLMTRGEIVYVCPGGAREALADAKDRYRLFWDGHYGFVRSAIRAGAPIVPMAILGHDETYAQIRTATEMKKTPLGRFIRRAFGEKYVTPLYMGLGPIPLPQRFHFSVGKPIEVPNDPERASDEATVEVLHGESQRALERLIADARVARARYLESMPEGTAKWVESTLLDIVR